jgi:hypothetical protein
MWAAECSVDYPTVLAEEVYVLDVTFQCPIKQQLFKHGAVRPSLPISIQGVGKANVWKLFRPSELNKVCGSSIKIYVRDTRKC